jgi:hypothetical protein
VSHVVVAGASELSAIVAFVVQEVAPLGEWSVETLSAREETTLGYEETSDSIEQLAARLSSGEVTSIQMRRLGRTFLVALYRPGFLGEPFEQWRCVFEGAKDEMNQIYGGLQARDGITFVSLSLGDAPELNAREVSVDSFPWNDWRLVRAAVRGADGDWVERPGSASRLS